MGSAVPGNDNTEGPTGDCPAYLEPKEKAP